GTVDAVACPAGGDPAFPISKEMLYSSYTDYNAARNAFLQGQNPPLKSVRGFTQPMDLAGLPAICLPAGFSPEGLPYSIQSFGRRLSESTLCRIAYAYEQATNWHTQNPRVDN